MPRRKDRPYNLVTNDCSTGKTAWSSERSAHRAARIATSEARDTFWHYRCPDCGAWHLTSSKYPPSLRPPGHPSDTAGRRPRPGQTVADLARQMREGK